MSIKYKFLEEPFPETFSPNDALVIVMRTKRYVATVGWGNDWAAYVGFASATNDDVARNGDKISLMLACEIFPELIESGRYYRE
jgi:hypothetical protein